VNKAWKTYLEYCGVIGQCAIPLLEDSLLSCLIWLDLTDAVLVCLDILAAVSRKHLERSLPDPSKLYNVRRVYKALMKESRKDRKPEWPRDPLLIFALRRFVINKPRFADMNIWIRDTALIAIGLRTMRRPVELCNLKLEDVKFNRNLCWIRICNSKTDQFSNGKFIPIEISNSLCCP
ncbi:10763_t:CDS:1, partial [Racocetra persica]